jgi:hypothetical protein
LRLSDNSPIKFGFDYFIPNRKRPEYVCRRRDASSKWGMQQTDLYVKGGQISFTVATVAVDTINAAGPLLFA